jgi:hypothetical protein
MPESPHPFSAPFNLELLSEEERQIILTPNTGERAAIAAWAHVDAVDGLRAEIRLRRAGAGLYRMEADLTADIRQTCVVTWGPVPSHIAASFARTFQLLPRHKGKQIGQDPAKAGATTGEGDDEVEVLDTSMLDLAGPVLEELSLAIDPYPRAQGAHFDLSDGGEARESPFAVLKTLKK